MILCILFEIGNGECVSGTVSDETRTKLSAERIGKTLIEGVQGKEKKRNGTRTRMPKQPDI